LQGADVKYLIRHHTRYRYAHPLRSAVQTLCLTPRHTDAQHVHRWEVVAATPLQAHTDAWGNHSHVLSVAAGARVIDCEAKGLVETFGSPAQTDGQGPDPRVYAQPSPLAAADDALRAAVREAWGGRLASEADALGLATLVADRVRYRAGQTDARTTAVQAWLGGEGVCQDHAHVFIAACRSLGVAARYVSGYFHAGDAPDLASHAWAQVCFDPAGRRWIGVDVTHRCLVDERHVQLAVGPDYAACPPVRGKRPANPS
jgi:transglutaminase-like putative cysteine protease